MTSREIIHYPHRHTLKFKKTEDPFKCKCCKENGIGRCYSCPKCKLYLHLDCAKASKVISHPLFHNSFQFMPKPPEGRPRSCHACKKDVTGCFYHCQAKGYVLHPCCAKLPKELYEGKLKLCRKASVPCHECEKKGGGWSYESSCKNYNFHVACLRKRLVKNWRDKYVEDRKCSHGDTGRRLPTGVPCLKDKVQTLDNKSKSKKKKWWKIACLALRFVISAMLGDPMTLILEVIFWFMS